MKKRWAVVLLGVVFLALLFGFLRFYWTLRSYSKKSFLKQKLEQSYGWEFRFETVNYQLPRQLKLRQVTIVVPGEVNRRVKIEAKHLLLEGSYSNLLLGDFNPELIVFQKPDLTLDRGLFGGLEPLFGELEKSQNLPEVRFKDGRLVLPADSTGRSSQLPFQKLKFSVLPDSQAYQFSLGNLRFGDGNASGKILLSPGKKGLRLKNFHANFINLRFIRDLFTDIEALSLLPRSGVLTTHLEELEYIGGRAKARGSFKFKEEKRPLELYSGLNSINSQFQARYSVSQGRLEARLFSPVVNAVNIPGRLTVKKTVDKPELAGEVELQEGPVSEWGFLLNEFYDLKFTEFFSLQGSVSPGRISFSRDTSGLRLNGDLKFNDIFVSANDSNQKLKAETAALRFTDRTAKLFPVEMSSDRTRVRLKGEVEKIFNPENKVLDLTVAGETFPVQKLKWLFPSNFYWPSDWQLKGEGSFESTYEGQIDTPVVQGGLEAKQLYFDSVPLKSIVADYSYESGRLVVEPLTGRLGDGQFQSSVVLKQTPRKHFDFWFQLNRTEFSTIENLPCFEQIRAGRGNIRAVLSGPPTAPERWEGQIEIDGWNLRVDREPVGRLLALPVKSLKQVIQSSLPDFYRGLTLALSDREVATTDSRGTDFFTLEQLSGRLKFQEERVGVNLQLVSPNFRYQLRGTVTVPGGKLNLSLRPRLKDEVLTRIKPGLLQRLLRKELPSFEIEGSLQQPGYNSRRFLKKLLDTIKSRRRKEVEQTPEKLYEEFFSD